MEVFPAAASDSEVLSLNQQDDISESDLNSEEFMLTSMITTPQNLHQWQTHCTKVEDFTTSKSSNGLKDNCLGNSNVEECDSIFVGGNGNNSDSTVFPGTMFDEKVIHSDLVCKSNTDEIQCLNNIRTIDDSALTEHSELSKLGDETIQDEQSYHGTTANETKYCEKHIQNISEHGKKFKSICSSPNRNLSNQHDGHRRLGVGVLLENLRLHSGIVDNTDYPASCSSVIEQKLLSKESSAESGKITKENIQLNVCSFKAVKRNPEENGYSKVPLEFQKNCGGIAITEAESKLEYNGMDGHQDLTITLECDSKDTQSILANEADTSVKETNSLEEKTVPVIIVSDSEESTGVQPCLNAALKNINNFDNLLQSEDGIGVCSSVSTNQLSASTSENVNNCTQPTLFEELVRDMENFKASFSGSVKDDLLKKYSKLTITPQRQQGGAVAGDTCSQTAELQGLQQDTVGLCFDLAAKQLRDKICQNIFEKKYGSEFVKCVQSREPTIHRPTNAETESRTMQQLVKPKYSDRVEMTTEMYKNQSALSFNPLQKDETQQIVHCGRVTHNKNLKKNTPEFFESQEKYFSQGLVQYDNCCAPADHHVLPETSTKGSSVESEDQLFVHLSNAGLPTSFHGLSHIIDDSKTGGSTTCVEKASSGKYFQNENGIAVSSGIPKQLSRKMGNYRHGDEVPPNFTNMHDNGLFYRQQLSENNESSFSEDESETSTSVSSESTFASNTSGHSESDSAVSSDGEQQKSTRTKYKVDHQFDQDTANPSKLLHKHSSVRRTEEKRDQNQETQYDEMRSMFDEQSYMYNHYAATSPINSIAAYPASYFSQSPHFIHPYSSMPYFYPDWWLSGWNETRLPSVDWRSWYDYNAWSEFCWQKSYVDYLSKHNPQK